jgi:hypothetical protein
MLDPKKDYEEAIRLIKEDGEKEEFFKKFNADDLDSLFWILKAIGCVEYCDYVMYDMRIKERDKRGE